MEVLDKIPFSPDVEALIVQAHADPDSEDAEEIKRLAGLAMKIGRPKAVYAEVFVDDRDEETVRLGGLTFHSSMLSRNLRAVERAFPYVATCGLELDEAYPTDGDPLKEFWRDMVKSQMLGAAGKYLDGHLERCYRPGRTAAMHPGAGDANIWPIEQQRELFALLGDVEGRIGVRLTESFLMVPNKTVSGIKFPVERDFHSCQVCRREGCPSRSAPLDEDLWASVQRG